MVTVDRRLFLTSDRAKLVDPDDPEAAFLWAGAGDEVNDDEAKELGYKASTKQAGRVEDKAVAGPAANKAAAKTRKV